VAKLIILSIVLMSFGLPIHLASARQARRSLRRMQTFTLVFIVAWAFMCLYWYPSIVTLK
jgi:hypothetical protein